MMSTTASLCAARGVTFPRLAVVLIFITTVYLCRDLYLPVTDQSRIPTSLGADAISQAGTPPSPGSDFIKNAELPPSSGLLFDHSRPPYVKSSLLPQSTVSTFDSSLPSHAATLPSSQSPEANSTCMDLPGADKVMVLLKTGATELYQKLPIHLLTTLGCTPNFLLYSDLNQTFASHEIHSAIDTVSTTTRSTHPDFELYRALQQHHSSNQDMSKLSGTGGWNLDKWKFLPMLHDAYINSPSHIDWFLIIEADTAISWLNLLLWLPHLKASENLYLGSQNVIGKSFFAHGGSGVLISRPAVAALETLRELEGAETYDGRWEGITAQSCCGDEVLARALLEAGTALMGAFPIIQGETPSTVDFTGLHWCVPAVTWHHVSPVQVDAQWTFQTQWVEKYGWERPMLYKDIFEHFVAPHIGETRKGWRNLSKDRKIVRPPQVTEEGDGAPWNELQDEEKASVESEQACEGWCRSKGKGECKQWMWMPGRCYLGKDVRLGRVDDEGERDQGEERWTSGWVENGEELGECEQVRWDVLLKQPGR
ncbi:unnamed protein product [Zymoseptoria tritici ST99CH_3D7]|uniref:Glycosyltransferase family 31 protein n=1 Tax=Zymoseptoria tritici (strain ST99CH_3D7) TaxID=1276538 RepID=A0A1X7RX32_ZYMT9|nr:unnamed protein product [Zymoseptoria tritici ST99CH_3D7]